MNTLTLLAALLHCELCHAYSQYHWRHREDTCSAHNYFCEFRFGRIHPGLWEECRIVEQFVPQLSFSQKASGEYRKSDATSFEEGCNNLQVVSKDLSLLVQITVRMYKKGSQNGHEIYMALNCARNIGGKLIPSIYMLFVRAVSLVLSSKSSYDCETKVNTRRIISHRFILPLAFDAIW